MLHGECIALGAVAAAFISWKHNWLSMEEYYEIRDMFVPFNLPISIDDIDPSANPEKNCRSSNVFNVPTFI